MTLRLTATWAASRQAASEATQSTVRWARTVARHLDIPLAQVLAWPVALLEEEIARVLLVAARRAAERHQLNKTEPPSHGDLFARAVAAIYADLVAEQEAVDAAASDAALERLMREG